MRRFFFKIVLRSCASCFLRKKISVNLKNLWQVCLCWHLLCFTAFYYAGGGINFLTTLQPVPWKMRLEMRVQGLPVRDCTGSCNRSVQRCTSVNAIVVTAKTFFERFYLVPGPSPFVPRVNRPTQSIMYIPFQVNICHKSILLILQYKYWKSCSEDLILKNPTKIWFSAQDHAVLILLIKTVGFFISARQKSAWLKWFVPQLYQHRRGMLEGPALIYMNHMCGWLSAPTPPPFTRQLFLDVCAIFVPE